MEHETHTPDKEVAEYERYADTHPENSQSPHVKALVADVRFLEGILGELRGQNAFTASMWGPLNVPITDELRARHAGYEQAITDMETYLLCGPTKVLERFRT